MAVELLKGLIEANLAAAAAILIVMALRAPVRRLAGARLAYGLWLLVPLAALATLVPARTAPAPLADDLGSVAIETAPAFDWQPLALAVWLAGAAIGAGFILWRQRAALGLLGRLSSGQDGLVRCANPAVGPAVIGVVRPRVVLPADFEQRFSPREQALIIAHERAHLEGGDARINAAVSLAACLAWPNPLAHLAARLVRTDQELACDAAVMARHPDARRTYAEALLKTQCRPAPLPLGCYWPARAPGRLKERILMLTLETPGRGRRAVGAALVATLGLGCGLAAWAAQPATRVAPAAAPVRTLARVAEPADIELALAEPAPVDLALAVPAAPARPAELIPVSAVAGEPASPAAPAPVKPGRAASPPRPLDEATIAHVVARVESEAAQPGADQTRVIVINRSSEGPGSTRTITRTVVTDDDDAVAAAVSVAEVVRSDPGKPGTMVYSCTTRAGAAPECKASPGEAVTRVRTVETGPGGERVTIYTYIYSAE